MFDSVVFVLCFSVKLGQNRTFLIIKEFVSRKNFASFMRCLNYFAYF